MFPTGKVSSELIFQRTAVVYCSWFVLAGGETLAERPRKRDCNRPGIERLSEHYGLRASQSDLVYNCELSSCIIASRDDYFETADCEAQRSVSDLNCAGAHEMFIPVVVPSQDYNPLQQQTFQTHDQHWLELDTSKCLLSEAQQLNSEKQYHFGELFSSEERIFRCCSIKAR